MGFLSSLIKALSKKPATPIEVAATPHASPAIIQSSVAFNQKAVNKVSPVVIEEADGYSQAFKEAFTKAMKWETGLKIDYKDQDIVHGRIDTKEQQRKVGYTDGVTGASRFDSGGETKFGVAQKAHPDLVVRTLTLGQAMAIYKKGYWDAVKGDQLVHGSIAKYVFDIGCGSGPQRGIKMLQQALGVAVDGNLGPLTIKAANDADPVVLLAKLQELRCTFYRQIVANNQSQSIFLQGWLNRANDLS